MAGSQCGSCLSQRSAHWKSSEFVIASRSRHNQRQLARRPGGQRGTVVSDETAPGESGSGPPIPETSCLRQRSVDDSPASNRAMTSHSGRRRVLRMPVMNSYIVGRIRRLDPRRGPKPARRCPSAVAPEERSVTPRIRGLQVPRRSWWLCTLAAATTLLVSPYRALLGQEPGHPPPLDTTYGRPPQDASVEDYSVDGATGKHSGATYLGRGDAVRLVIRDVNPFRFQYKIVIDTITVSEPSAGDFFALALGIAASPAGGAPHGTISPAYVVSFASEGAECPPGTHDTAGANVLFKRLSSDVGALENDTKDVRQSLSDAATADSLLRRTITPLLDSIQSDTASAPRVVQLANDVSSAIRDAMVGINPPLDTARTHYAALTRGINSLGLALDSALRRFGACEGFGDVAVTFDGLVRDSVALRLVLTQADTAVAHLQSAQRDYANTPHERFFIQQRLGPFHAPTILRVRILRKAVGAADATLTLFSDQELTFDGAGRISISVGPMWSHLPLRTFGIAHRFVSPATAPSDTVGSFIVLTDNEQNRVVPMVTLNTLLIPVHNYYVSGFQAVFGVGLHPGERLLNIQYYIGGGLGFFGNRVLLTCGGFLAPVTQLVAGYAIGDRVPSVTSAAELTRQSLAMDLGVGLVYSIR